MASRGIKTAQNIKERMLKAQETFLKTKFYKERFPSLKKIGEYITIEYPELKVEGNSAESITGRQSPSGYYYSRGSRKGYKIKIIHKKTGIVLKEFDTSSGDSLYQISYYVLETIPKEIKFINEHGRKKSIGDKY